MKAIESDSCFFHFSTINIIDTVLPSIEKPLITAAKSVKSTDFACKCFTGIYTRAVCWSREYKKYKKFKCSTMLMNSG